MHPSPTTTPDDAATTLAGIRATREKTRSDLCSYWFALVLFGTLTLLSTPFYSMGDGTEVGLFWLVAAPLGMAVMARYHHNRDEEIGVRPAPRAYVITSVALIAACFATGFGGGLADQPDVSSFGPPLAIAVAYVVFARLDRSALLAVMACVLGGLTIALAVADASNPGPILAATYGASFLITGLMVRRCTPTRR